MSDAPGDFEREPSTLLCGALEVAIEAGRRILEIYADGFSVAEKHDATPLTEADMAAHHVIERGLLELTPGLPVLSEESEEVPYEVRSTWRRYWLVDPLDGTREFIKRSGEFTVNIALIEDQEPVVGIVYAPVLGTYYYACRGEGAYKRSAMNDPRRIHVRGYEGGLVTVAGTRIHPGATLARFLGNIGNYVVIPMGSALKSCLVAEGKADIYARFGPTSEWDTAAAQCVLEEAGGQLTDTRMRPLRYNTKDSLKNPHFFAFGDSSVDWSRFL